MSLGISLNKLSLPACALSALLLTGCGAVVAEGLAAATLGGVLGGKGSAAKELVKDAVSDDGTVVRAAAGEAAREETEGTRAGRIIADAVSGDIAALAADSAAAGTGEAGSPADMLPPESPLPRALRTVPGRAARQRSARLSSGPFLISTTPSGELSASGISPGIRRWPEQPRSTR